MPLVTECAIRVRSTDMDADGIMNNARYFEYFEQARLDHLVRLDIIRRQRQPGEPPRSFTIAETRCRFLAPLRHRDQVTVRAWTGEIRTRSFMLAYEIVRDDGTRVAEGDSAIVWLDAEGRPTALSDAERAALVASAADERAP